MSGSNHHEAIEALERIAFPEKAQDLTDWDSVEFPWDPYHEGGRTAEEAEADDLLDVLDAAGLLEGGSEPEKALQRLKQIPEAMMALGVFWATWRQHRGLWVQGLGIGSPKLAASLWTARTHIFARAIVAAAQIDPLVRAGALVRLGQDLEHITAIADERMVDETQGREHANRSPDSATTTPDPERIRRNHLTRSAAALVGDFATRARISQAEAIRVTARCFDISPDALKKAVQRRANR